MSETSRKSKYRILIAFALISGCIMGYYFAHFAEFLAWDSCADLGGAYDYQNNICSNDCSDLGGEWNDTLKVCNTSS